MIFAHCKLIQEGESALFYYYSRTRNGYMIAGILVAPNAAAKLSFAKLWTYFVSEVVQADDIYCSVSAGIENSMFMNYLDFLEEIDGLKIYKVDNFLKEKYSTFAKHLTRTN